MKLEFVETSYFTKRVTELLSDDEYRRFQNELLENPERGKLMKGTNGLRKIRCATEGKGKRGSARVIYYYKVVANRIYLLFLYKKNEQGDLTAEQRKKLGALAGSFENER